MLSKSATTFQVSDKTPEKNRKFQLSQNASQEGIKQMLEYRRNACSEVLQSTVFPANSFISSNGFVKTVVDCYIDHHSLILRPDDIWASIMTQFSFYINKHAEEFRKKFVAFEGKKELVVAIPGTLRTALYDLFVKMMIQTIDENLLDPEVKQWILPDFSTTTDNDLVSVGVIFMAAMKKYFTYTCVRLGCGIPSITLEGTVEDWKKVSDRIEKLKEYKLENWYDMLKPILKEFVNAKEGKVDLDFWQRICHHKRGGSGSGPFISGWLTAFCPFDKDGNTWLEYPMWQQNKRLKIEDEEDQASSDKWPWLNVKKIPTGIVEVEVKIIDEGTKYTSVMFAGPMAVELLDEGHTLKPSLGWVIALKKEEAAKKAVADSGDESLLTN